MPSYEIKGKATGRKRKRIYSAVNELAARKLAEEDGTLVDEAREIPPEPPTERQLDYAKDLGISISENLTKRDLSDLISIKVDRDKPSTERHKKFGKMYGIEFTDYIGKKNLFDRIQSELLAPGRENELLSWFTFRVYRNLSNAADNTPIEGPDDLTIQEISKELVADKKIVRSVRRYEGSKLIWFGEWTSPSGYVHTGGSNRTIAYKKISSMLKERVKFLINPQEIASAKSGNKKAKSEPKGCLPVISFVLVIPVSIILSAAWAGENFA